MSRATAAPTGAGAPARGVIRPRSHLQSLVQYLHAAKGEVETVVWTHARRSYAAPFVGEHLQWPPPGVARRTERVATHCIYAELGGALGAKSLSRLGRPRGRVLLVENNAASVDVGDRDAAVIVPDFVSARSDASRSRHPVARQVESDRALLTLIELIDEMRCRAAEGVPTPVADALACSPLVLRTASGLYYLK